MKPIFPQRLQREIQTPAYQSFWKRIYWVIMMFYCANIFLFAAHEPDRSGLEIAIVPIKYEYVMGEPVILNLMIRNTSEVNVNFIGGEQAYIFSVLDKHNNLKNIFSYPTDGWSGKERRFYCKPDTSVFEKIILNKYLAFSEPGDYLVSYIFGAVFSPREVKIYPPAGGQLLRSGPETAVSNKISIVISPFNETKVLNAARQLSEKLVDSDVQTRQDAAEALGYFHGSDSVISNVMSYLVNIPHDEKQQVRDEIEKAINRLQRKIKAHKGN
ncbi:MAG: hypothetical protein Q7J98_12910 [Kiritimatiellia bacterium]|nr:hypothetical protein [Kiritimatiellia bacterium]